MSKIGRPRVEASKEKFLAMLIPTDGGCLEYSGALSSRYANYGTSGRKHPWGRLAHRAAWYFEHGAIPAGRFICHKCNNKKCCNVQHLYLGDVASNGDDLAMTKAHSCRVLTSAQASHIKDRLSRGEKMYHIELSTGVPSSIIANIRDGISYRYD